MRRLVASLLPLLLLLPAALGAASPELTPYLRGVPYFSQRQNALDPSGSCQNTTMAIVLRHYGAGEVTADRITRRWGTGTAQTVGGWAAVFNTLAEESGLPVRDRGASDGRPSDLQRLVAAGTPVVVHGAFTNAGHLVVLLGFDGRYYYAHDPYGDWTTGYSEWWGRHVRYPKEDFERAVGDWIRYHRFELVDTALSLTWATPPPDSLIASGRTAAALAVRLAGAADGDLNVTADLSAIGGPTRVVMVAAGAGEYRVAEEVAVTPEYTGLRRISVRAVRGDDAAELIAAVAVLPVRDKAVYADAWDSSWQVGPVHRMELDPGATGRVYEGAAALRLQAGGFNLSLRPQQPLEPHGYSYLNFAFLPDSVSAGDASLSVYVNDDARTIVKVAAPDGDHLADTRLRTWQVVEVPMTAFSWLEEPIESLHLMGRLDGAIYLDDIRLVAARPCPISASWVSAPPDTLVTGQSAQVTATLRLASEIVGAAPEVTVDLGALGGGHHVPLVSAGQGVYQLIEEVGVNVANGLYEITFRIQQEGHGETHVLQLARPVRVIPSSDHVIFDDALHWESAYVIKAELQVVEMEEAFEGGAALAVAAQYFTVDLRARVPVDPTGYQYLRFAFNPGTATAAAPPAFNISLNGDGRTSVRLLEEGDAGVSLDLGRPGWQQVEIPVAAFGDFEGAIETVRFLGSLQGVFYLDDVRLVAARAPEKDTAVIEESGAPRPGRTALLVSYPNPFNVETVIPYELAAPGPVELTVYNSVGQAVRSLVRGQWPAGAHTVHWDGRGDAGARVASGLYIVQLRAGGVRQARKLLLLR